MSQSQYVDRKDAAKSYRPVAGSMSPGLKRAREPYRVKNALVGLALGAFAVGIWAYSINAVKQDVFDDVDEEARALQGSTTTSAPGGAAATGVVTVAAPANSTAPASPAAALADTTADKSSKPIVSTPIPVIATPPPASSSSKTRGVVPRLVETRMPWLLDPERKTLVWGAPSVDNVGKTSSKLS